MMKVYEVSALARPTGGKFPNYAVLVADRGVHDFLRLTDGEFFGAPFSRKWKKQRLYFEKPKWPRADFLAFGVGKFVCNQRARVSTAEALEMAGELLPVSIEGDVGRYWLYNVTNCINCLNPRKSIWLKLGPRKTDRILKRAAFFPERLGEVSLFKIQEDNGGRIYCLERSCDPDDGEFKAVVESAGLTGLKFTQIWSDKK